MDAFERESLPPDGIPESRSGASLANPCAVSLIAYATQNGLTEDLAFATREALGASGRAIEVLAFDELRVARLASAGGALLLTSTTGDGDPPDMAAGFAADCMRQPAALTSLRYALLVLGDRGYTHFCGFGRRLDRWLTQSGARAAFPRIEVDDENAAALERWYQAVRNWHAGPGVAVNNRDEAHAP